MAQVTCYDGVGCIGGNKILLEDGDCRLFFDFGTNFGAEGRFYEEFLRPKTCTGLYEQVVMGLIPPLRGLYRDDLQWDECDPWTCVECLDVGDVSGVLVSHAHVDHMGAVHFLRTDIPIYCTATTAAVCHALQTTGSSSTPSDYCYCSRREAKADAGLGSEGSAALGRRFHLVDPPQGSEFQAFWARSPWKKRSIQIQEFGDASVCGGRKIRCWPVDHSIYGAAAWAVETDAGWVVYSGDLRLHGAYSDFTRRFSEEAARLAPAALILEGTRVNVGLGQDARTEQDVAESCLEAVRGCRGLVVADFGPRNVERLLSFRDVALQSGRKLAMLPKDAYLLDILRSAASAQTVPPLERSWARIYWEYSSESSRVWRDTVRDSFAELIVRPHEVAAAQDQFICCFSFWDVNELAYLRPVPGSIWIYSSCEAFDEEMAITAARLDNWLRYMGVERLGRLTKEEQEADPFHVSGHASGPDLFDLVRTIRPRKLIPIHSEHPEFYVENVGDVCEVVLPERGAPIQV